MPQRIWLYFLSKTDDDSMRILLANGMEQALLKFGESAHQKGRKMQAAPARVLSAQRTRNAYEIS